MESIPAERNSAFFRFEELRIYHKALDYITWVHNATSSFRADASDNLAVQFNESARSIALNIAEGSARNKSQFIYYLKMAKSAVREALVLSSACRNLEFLSEEQNTESRNYLMEMTKMIGALISSLQRSQDAAIAAEESDDDLMDNTKSFDSHNF
jgi:four helix bundle protein